jgi:hypothetical protein
MAKTTTTHGVQSMNYHVPSVVDGSPISVRRWLPPPEVNTKAALAKPIRPNIFADAIDGFRKGSTHPTALVRMCFFPSPLVGEGGADEVRAG